MNDDQPTPTALIADGVLDAQLCALLWLLAEGGVPLVAAARDIRAAQTLRSAIGMLAGDVAATDDGALRGGTVLGAQFEDVLRLAGGSDAATIDVSDEARDLGVVCVLADAATPAGFVVRSAHYVRPVERDVAGHLQRRPPALLTAHDVSSGGFDHFFWAITDELATRVDIDPSVFELTHRRRTQLLDDVAAAGVRDHDHLRRHIERAALVEAHMGTIRADTTN